MPDYGGDPEGILRLPEVPVENSPKGSVRAHVGKAGTEPPRLHEDRELPGKGGDGGAERFFLINVHKTLL